jgi:cellulose synthase/poly-beta-1,6-N-acetylglucosamine synthase-like glycosyltransferase
LNAGLRQATDEDIVVRLDAHAIYGPNYLSEAVSSLERAPADVGCIGGAPIPASGTTFEERVVEALYRNPMGLGPADFRSGDDVREVDQVYLGVWRPGLLGRAGGFNEALDANEDSEMSSRIRRLGYKILRVQLPCRFIANKGVWGSVRQWYRYGYWRCKMLQCNPRSIRPRHLFPPVMSLCLVGLACSPARILLIPLGAAYAVLVYRWRPKDQSLLVTLGTVVFFPAVQAAWALGLFHALLSGAGGVRRSLTPAGTVVAE